MIWKLQKDQQMYYYGREMWEQLCFKRQVLSKKKGKVSLSLLRGLICFWFGVLDARIIILFLYVNESQKSLTVYGSFLAQLERSYLRKI